MNHQKAATIEVVGLKKRIEELERISREYVAKTDPLLDKLEPMSDRISELESIIEKIEAECMRGLSLERNCRSALHTIAMLARSKP